MKAIFELYPTIIVPCPRKGVLPTLSDGTTQRRLTLDGRHVAIRARLGPSSDLLPLGPLLAQLELVELRVGDQRLNGRLVEAALLRRVGLEHREDRPALAHGAVQLLERVLLLEVLGRAEDEDALGLVDLRRARAALEVVDVEEDAGRGQRLGEARLDDAHAVLRLSLIHI